MSGKRSTPKNAIAVKTCAVVSPLAPYTSAYVANATSETSVGTAMKTELASTSVSLYRQSALSSASRSAAICAASGRSHA